MLKEPHYWFCNTTWDNRCGYVGTEEEALRLTNKPHLIIFQEDPQVMIETGNY